MECCVTSTTRVFSHCEAPIAQKSLWRGTKRTRKFFDVASTTLQDPHSTRYR